MHPVLKLEQSQARLLCNEQILQAAAIQHSTTHESTCSKALFIASRKWGKSVIAGEEEQQGRLAEPGREDELQQRRGGVACAQCHANVSLQGQRSSKEDVQNQAEKMNRSSDVEVLLVRSAEKVLDAVNGLLEPTAWNPQVLDRHAGLKILQVTFRTGNLCDNQDSVVTLCCGLASVAEPVKHGLHVCVWPWYSSSHLTLCSHQAVCVCDKQLLRAVAAMSHAACCGTHESQSFAAQLLDRYSLHHKIKSFL